MEMDIWKKDNLEEETEKTTLEKEHLETQRLEKDHLKKEMRKGNKNIWKEQLRQLFFDKTTHLKTDIWKRK